MVQVVPSPPCGRLGAAGRPTLLQSLRGRGGRGAERDRVGGLAPRTQICGGGGPPDTASESLEGGGGGGGRTGSRVAPGPTRTQRFAGYRRSATAHRTVSVRGGGVCRGLMSSPGARPPHSGGLVVRHRPPRPRTGGAGVDPGPGGTWLAPSQCLRGRWWSTTAHNAY